MEPPTARPGPAEDADIASMACQFLISQNYLLSAFELMVEAQESGNEQQVEMLSHFFSDRTKFPPEKLAEFELGDAVSAQKLAKEREAQLSATQYQLRVLQEDMADMQAQQDSRAGTGAASPAQTATGHAQQLPAFGLGLQDGSGQAPQGSQEAAALPARELAQLHSSMHAYLARAGYKLTAMTFAEEAGSHVAGPAQNGTLLSMFQGYQQWQAAMQEAEECRAAAQELQGQLEAAQRQADDMQAALDAANSDSARLRSETDMLRQQVEWQQQQLLQPLPSRSVESQKQEPAARAITQEALSGAEAALDAIARQLPALVQHLLIKQRHEIVPALLAIIRQQQDGMVRDQLVHTLFNLVKKPNSEQRRVILDSYIELAVHLGPARTAAELLPQCWEQVNHRHAERRVLVTEGCARLAAHVTPDMRASLILSMFQQLASDADSSVRTAVACGVADVLPHLPDWGKYHTVEALCLQLSQDGSQAVIDAVFESLLPALLSWLAQAGSMLQSFMLAVLEAAASLLERCPYLGGTEERLIEQQAACLRAVTDHQQRQVQVLLRLYTAMLPSFRSHALLAKPAWMQGADQASLQEASLETASSVGSGNHSHAEAAAKLQPDVQGSSRAGSMALHEEGPGLQAAHSPSSSAAVSQSPWEDLSLSDSIAPLQESSHADPLRPSSSADLAGQALPAEASAANSQVDMEATSGRSRAEADAAAAVQAFACWAHNPPPEPPWEAVDDFVVQHLPQLLRVTWMIPPHQDMEALRRRLCASLKSICTCFGVPFAAAVVQPVATAAAATPLSAPQPVTHPILEEALRAVHCSHPEAQRVGNVTVLPLLLAGVLPHCSASQEALVLYVRLLVAPSSSGVAWAQHHLQEFREAVRFAAVVPELQAPLTSLLWELAVKPALAPRLAAAAVAAALMPALSAHQAMRHLLPALETLSQDAELPVRTAAISAMGRLVQLHGAHADLLDKLQAHFDELLGGDDHQVQLAVVQSLAAHVGQADPRPAEYLLQKVLLLLAAMHKRSACGKTPVQLHELAEAAFDALRAVNACEMQEPSVRLHLVAALQSLQRESELLDSTQVDLVLAMLQDSGAASLTPPRRASSRRF